MHLLITTDASWKTARSEVSAVQQALSSLSILDSELVMLFMGDTSIEAGFLL
jgi:hypothetical protein